MNGMELMAPAHSQFPSAHSSDLLLPAATASVENASRTNTSPAHSNQEPNLAPGLQLKISGIDELLASLIIDNGVGEPTEFHGIAGEQILHPITDDCKEIVLCIETQCRQIYDDPDVATANIAIELVETWNGVTRTAAALKKKKLDRFFKAQREHALHPMDPVYDHEGQTHYKWGAFRTQDRLRKDLEVAETCDTVLEATPALRSIIQDQRFLYCWRGFSSNRRYRSLSLNSDNGYMGRDYTASYIEDQAVSIVTTHLDRFRFKHVSMSVKCYLETASIMHHVRPLIKQTIGNSLADQEATDDSVHDYRALYIAKRVLAQQREALFEFSTSLDDIELNLGDERMFLLVLPRWTKVFPDWRNHLMHTEAHLAYLCHSLSRRPTASAPASRGDFAEVIELAKRLQSAVISYRTRLEMTCQVISILTGVVSADRSLQEADGVAKLSHLAFFFVPLGLVAALFSMDIALTPLLGNYSNSKTTISGYGLRHRLPPF
ncbi:hypothetical protein F503_08668 [Ophiostoma piceae UAMH 11346]|uniref:Uncharacterized protein n=1 Tax=Ophiostoma piceae (strain UAMH 11346) TaxID=1262450 RepID=S3BP67_OPHP1|nr:hypothetical protein F503_08668 [Ophiostoma piceae UAMH 11346]